MGDISIPTQELLDFSSRALLTKTKVTAFIIYLSNFLTLKCIFLGVVINTGSSNPFLQPDTFTDPLANASACQRDVTFLKQLTVNVIRVYSVNSSLNHDTCMSLFSQAGIYTM
jgi:hypothetical protein